MLLGLKTGLIFFISLYLQHVNCPLGSNVDECLHVDVCTHCRAVRDHYRPALVLEYFYKPDSKKVGTLYKL